MKEEGKEGMGPASPGASRQYRPLIEGEIIEATDECFGHGEGPWNRVCPSSVGRHYSEDDFHEMRRPLPEAPEAPKAPVSEANGSTHNPLPLDLEALESFLAVCETQKVGFGAFTDPLGKKALNGFAESVRRLREKGTGAP